MGILLQDHSPKQLTKSCRVFGSLTYYYSNIFILIRFSSNLMLKWLIMYKINFSSNTFLFNFVINSASWLNFVIVWTLQMKKPSNFVFFGFLVVLWFTLRCCRALGCSLLNWLIFLFLFFFFFCRNIKSG